ncbi:MAG: DUF2231 domain-containing protein [Ferruginibacter sp.]
MKSWKNIIYNCSFALNCLLVFLLIFGNNMNVPLFLKVAGRMHPMILHFPIVLLILSFLWEAIVGAKHEPAIKAAGDWLLLSASFTAVIAALMGFFLSKEGGYDAESIAWHKWTGVLISLVALGWYAMKDFVRQKKVLSITVGALSVAAIVLAGHQGANITHGENFILAPVTPDKLQPVVLFEDAVAYTHLIKPILEVKCITCHNTNKAKGDLVMETEQLLLKGGKHGNLWDSAPVGFGLMMQRVHLPLEEKKHMPPKGKPQLTEDEIKAIYYWIKDGASFSKKIADLSPTDSLRIVAASFFKTVEGSDYTFAPADESAIKKLNNDFRVVTPLAIGSPALGVEFYGASFFKSEQLKDLQTVGEQVVTLNLNKMPVKDEDLKIIGTMKNLRKLNLSFTQVTGASLSELKNLKELRQLSLSGTGVKAADLAVLKELPKLSSLYIWNTSIGNNDIAGIKKLFPKTTIGTGFRGDTIIAKLNSPVIEGDEVVFREKMGIKLKNYIKGASMIYTLDGSEPDSLKSLVYKDSIVIDKPVQLKAKAFLPGWTSSDVISKNYFKATYLADSVKLLTEPNKDYKGVGGATLSNRQKGELNYRTDKWLGYRGNDLVAMLYFNRPTLLSSVNISTVIDIGAYLMPAKEVEVWAGTNNANMTLLKKFVPAQPDSVKPSYLTSYEFTFKPKEITLLKIVVKPVMKLPLWHSGKGQNAWIFVDEIFLN